MKSTVMIFVTFCLAVCSVDSVASQPESEQAICQCIDELCHATSDMKGEIKSQLRGTKGYGRMLATNAMLRTKTAAIQRRLNRDLCYRRLERDVARLNELACELQEQFDELLACATAKRPVCADIDCFVAKLHRIRSLASCVRIEACCNLGTPVPAPYVVPMTTPASDPSFPVIEPIQDAPIFEPAMPSSSIPSVLEIEGPTIVSPEGGR